ncbi:MAG: DUF3574 domain-containing protein [Alphaproteobacteria bacterium]|nr:DUF3574 domain-containing protein [Alphaproteobacteria bacterium]
MSEREWHHFEEDTLNRDFPDGMTVQSASGKWMDPATRHEVSEPSKTVLAVTGDAPDLMKRIEDVSEVYKHRFRQKSVGIVSQRVCARF